MKQTEIGQTEPRTPASREIDTATTGFDPRWLILRETVDHVVRPSHLVPELSSNPVTLHVVDLACGTGSNLRYLSPLLPVPQRWLLLDYDAGLLEDAGRRCSEWIAGHGRTGTVMVATQRCDLSAGIPAAVLDSSALSLSGLGSAASPAHGHKPVPMMVTGSALADLVSRDWLERVTDQLTTAEHVTAVLLATVYNGAVSFDPADPDDEAVIAAFHRNMHRDKGFGPALGADAAQAVSAAFARNWAVMEADSTWLLDEECRQRMGAADFDRLLGFQLGFFVDASASEGFDATNWGARRELQRSRGQLSIRVGHTDVLAQRRPHHHAHGSDPADSSVRIPTA